MRTPDCVSRGHARLWLGLLLVSSCSAFALSHRYDAAGRLEWSVQPTGQATRFTYDPAGNITAVLVVTPAQDTDTDGLPDTWEIRFSPTTTARDPVADPDADGLVDLQEFGFLRLPDGVDGANLTPVSIETAEAGAYLTLRYLRPIQGTATLNYIAEVSTDLHAWSAALDAVEQAAPVAQGGGAEMVVVRTKLPADPTRWRFLRVRVARR